MFFLFSLSKERAQTCFRKTPMSPFADPRALCWFFSWESECNPTLVSRALVCQIQLMHDWLQPFAAGCCNQRVEPVCFLPTISTDLKATSDFRRDLDQTRNFTFVYFYFLSLVGANNPICPESVFHIQGGCSCPQLNQRRRRKCMRYSGVQAIAALCRAQEEEKDPAV